MRTMIAVLLAIAWSTAAHATKPMIQTRTRVVQPGQRIEGIAFPPGTLVTIIVKTGEVSSIQLASDTQLQGRIFKKGTQIYLHPLGKLGTAFTVTTQSIDGIPFNGGAQIEFDDQGHIDMAHIARDTRIGKATYAANTWVSFYPNGRVKEGELARPLNNGLLHLAPGPVAFWPNGRLQHALLAQAATINGNNCKVGEIGLFASGHIDTCASDHAFNNKVYACASDRTLYALSFADQNAEINYQGRSRRMDRLPPSDGHLRYADSEMEWRPPPNDTPDSVGTMLERVPGQQAPRKTECLYRPHG